MLSTIEIGKKIVELSNAHKGIEAVDTLYADNIVSIEAASMPGSPRRTEGKAAIRAKHVVWYQNNEIHSSIATGPWPHDDRFIVNFKIDITAKAGPMSGQRIQMEEAALYTVKDGKIVKEEFFYSMDC